ncbi:MarR family transcriptional regulator [Natronorubrum daqingense]|uniref:Iron dependent repressor, N-terminal DNA binding domain n=1 Tax=Natronorubrum daqingense TaxID=588898 RepID=A0A1N7C454_9EURY|nr:MarR family transcriptional regulator [Natronorubrum daqingense]APX96725.1 MarR family transcriptional regulator [Natronorubrum daqingense]SIR58223.1 Iron dependent repressor, N-terminal DNA binding domain [Natronorubrum daqingense]
MSIDIEDFEVRSPKELEEPSNAERVLRFLYEHRDKAWKASTIAERSGVNKNSISAVLNRLKEQDLVRHKGSYWAITDDTERLRRAHQFHRTVQQFNELYGEEDRDEWTEASDQASE